MNAPNLDTPEARDAYRAELAYLRAALNPSAPLGVHRGRLAGAG